MIRTRKLLAVVSVVCIVAMLAAAVTPALSHAFDAVLVPLEPQFGTVLSVPVPQEDEPLPAAAPVPSVRSPRAPPLA